jgi:hypothetical protein
MRNNGNRNHKNNGGGVERSWKVVSITKDSRSPTKLARPRVWMDPYLNFLISNRGLLKTRY